MKPETVQTWEENPQGEYPSPVKVVEAALATIQPDGSVIMYDEETGEAFPWEAGDPVDVESLPEDVRDRHKLEVARSISGTVSALARWPDHSDRWLGRLATHLTIYRHDQEFIQKAASLMRVDEQGYLHEPSLSASEPWTPASIPQKKAVERALRRIDPDLPFDDWVKITAEIHANIGSTAAHLLPSFLTITNGELRFIASIANKMLEQLEEGQDI